jgi:peptidylprolyl isomerase
VNGEAVREGNRQTMRRRSVVLLSGACVALVAGIIGCSNESTKPTREIPAQTADGKPCVAATVPPVTTPPGTDAAGGTTPGATVPTPDFTVPVGPPPTELKTTDLKEGTGAVVKEGDTVTAHYIGVACSTGKVFDSSYEKGQPLTKPLDQLIKGWGQGMVGMKEGGTRQMIIPPALAYGDNPPSPEILPGETLIFVVELQKTETPPPTTTTTAAPATTAAPPAGEATTTTTKAP